MDEACVHHNDLMEIELERKKCDELYLPEKDNEYNFQAKLDESKYELWTEDDVRLCFCRWRMEDS